MPTVAGYAGRINREGGSILSIGSGGSLNFAAGGTIRGVATFGASVPLEAGFSSSGGSNQFVSTASVLIKPSATTLNNPVVVMQVGRNQMWYVASSAGSITLAASPGDFLWQANSASTALWLNASDGTAGSRWFSVRLATGSQLTGAF